MGFTHEEQPSSSPHVHLNRDARLALTLSKGASGRLAFRARAEHLGNARLLFIPTALDLGALRDALTPFNIQLIIANVGELVESAQFALLA